MLIVPEAFPRVTLVRQVFPATPPFDWEASLPGQLTALAGRLAPGARVAVAVGSRGMADLHRVVEAIVAALRAAGAEPFILPAMGSHGGATPEGQTALLADYGVSETGLGVPVRATMDVEEIGRTPEGVPVVCSVEALRADALVLLNRVKPHTDFGGDLGSGLAKMLVVGLGKHVGAANFHRAAEQFGHLAVLRTAARVVRGRVPLLAAVAVIENQRHELARLEVVRPETLEQREPELCAKARALMPRLPFDELDLLIVDRMGKNISGTGMDPAVIGRMIHGYSTQLDPAAPPPRVRRLFVRDLTPESRGNAIGLGMADFTTDRLVRAMDARVTFTNSLTALSLQGAKVPIHFATDREVLTAALATLPDALPGAVRLARITDTLSLETLQVSEAMLAGIAGRGDLELMEPLKALEFDAEGNLKPWAER